MSNPLGPDTRNITANVPTELFMEVERLARLSGCSPSTYVRALCSYAKERNLVAIEDAASVSARANALKRGISPLPKITYRIAEDRVSEVPAVTDVVASNEDTSSLRVAEDSPSQRRKRGTGKKS